MKNVLIVIVLIISVRTYGQQSYGFEDGEVVKKDGAILSCLVELNVSYGSWVKYKRKKNSPIDSINIKDIKKLITMYNVFENMKYDGTERLMSIMSRGEATLYVHITFEEPRDNYFKGTRAGQYYKPNYFYLLRFHDELGELKKEDFKMILTQLFNQCETVVKKINKKKTKFDEIPTLVQEYNDNCGK